MSTKTPATNEIYGAIVDYKEACDSLKERQADDVDLNHEDWSYEEDDEDWFLGGQ